MKVIVGDTIYDPNDTPVMVMLTEDDKRLIAGMTPETMLYCSYPDDTPPYVIREWMREMKKLAEEK